MTTQKPKAIIEDIMIPKDRLDKLNKMLESNRSRVMKDLAIRRTAGGRCCRCELVPTKIVKYKLQGITFAERYCTSCFDKIKGELS